MRTGLSTPLIVTLFVAGCASPFAPIHRWSIPMLFCEDGTRAHEGMVACASRNLPFTRCASDMPVHAPVALSEVASLRATQVGLGHHGFACALDEAGAAHCWGGNGLGSTDGDRIAANCAPNRVRVPPLQMMSVGASATCGMSEGSIWCWGSNHTGIRAPTDFTDFFPTRIQTELHPTALAVGPNAACALVDRTIWCWGALRQTVSRRGTRGALSTELLRGPSCPEHFECDWVAVGERSACMGGPHVAMCASFLGAEAASGGWAASGEFQEGEETRFFGTGRIGDPCFMGDQLCYLAGGYSAVRCGDGGAGDVDWHVEGHALACSNDTLCVLQENRALCHRYAVSGVLLSEFEVAGTFTDLAIAEGAVCGVSADGSVQCGGWASAVASE